MEKPVEIDILGHKAKIVRIKGYLKDGVWRKEDYIGVSFQFEEAVDSILEFNIDLPVLNYGKEEFLKAVCQEGETKLGEMLEQGALRRQLQIERESRQRDLDSLVAQIEAMISK